MSEKQKPPRIDGVFDMSHVPPPNPENFWELELDDPRVVMVEREPRGLAPRLTLVVRRIEGNRVWLQIVAAPGMKSFKPS